MARSGMSRQELLFAKERVLILTPLPRQDFLDRYAGEIDAVLRYDSANESSIPQWFRLKR